MNILEKTNISLMTQIIIIFILLVSSNTLADPTSSGGAKCSNNIDCGGMDAGICKYIINGTGICACPSHLADPNCTYIRIYGNYVCGLQLLCVIGFGGVGNFVLGNIGIAVGQLLLTLPMLLVCVTFSIAMIPKKYNCRVPIVTSFISRWVTDDWEICRHPFGMACIFSFCAITAGITWCLVDAALIVDGIITDSNGYATYFTN